MPSASHVPPTAVTARGPAAQEPVKIQVDLLGLSDGILAEIRPCGTFTCTPAPPTLPSPASPAPASPPA
jgi:hypothetical protein